MTMTEVAQRVGKFDTAAYILESYGHEVEPLTHFVASVTGGLDKFADGEELLRAFDLSFYGEFEDVEEFAQHYCESTGMVDTNPDNVAMRHIDWRKVANELHHDFVYAHESEFISRTTPVIRRVYVFHRDW